MKKNVSKEELCFNCIEKDASIRYLQQVIDAMSLKIKTMFLIGKKNSQRSKEDYE